MSNELVSVIITTCKREPQIIKRAVSSVLLQTYPHFELIVVDDSPNDYPFREAVHQMLITFMDYRIRYVPHKTNLGACAARNTGLSLSTGAYIAYLDDDDEWLTSKLEKQVTLMQHSSSDVALVYCRSIMVFDKLQTEKTTTHSFERGYVFPSLILRNFIGSTSLPLLRTACLREIGGFDEQLQASQDFDVWLRIAQKYSVDYIDEPLVRYHYHDGYQITRSPTMKIAGMERVNQKYHDYIQSHRNVLWRRTLGLAPLYAWNKEYSKAARYWIKAILINPWGVKTNLKYLYYALRRIGLFPKKLSK